MKLYFYRGDRPNFGDELNLWLMPRLFPDFFDTDESELFLGIGSILSDIHSPGATKIVFGSGYGGYTGPPAIDESWRIYCVRGPLTAEVLGLGSDKVAGDTAILINRYRTRPAKRHRFSFIPHWESLARGNWPLACRLAGMHFLDPTLPVETVLAEIEASEVVVTEAMHGAIVADALRVPWIAVRPFHAIHHMKWDDWAGALDLTVRPVTLAPSSFAERRIAVHGSERGGVRLARAVERGAGAAGQFAMAWRAARSLRAAQAATPQLSSDDALATAIGRLDASAAAIRRDFPR